MKTKALLLAAAVLGTLIMEATAATETVTLTLPPNFCLVANPLNHAGGNTLNNVLPNVPPESQVLKYLGGNYSADIFDGSVWLDATTGEPSSTQVGPGEGFFFFNPTSQELQATLAGNKPQGNLNVALVSGFSLVGSKVFGPVSLTASNGFPQVEGMQILRFDCAAQTYRTIILDPCPFAGGGYCWLHHDTGEPADSTIPVGEGFFVFNPTPSSLNWVRIASP